MIFKQKKKIRSLCEKRKDYEKETKVKMSPQVFDVTIFLSWLLGFIAVRFQVSHSWAHLVTSNGAPFPIFLPFWCELL